VSPGQKKSFYRIGTLKPVTLYLAFTLGSFPAFLYGWDQWQGHGGARAISFMALDYILFGWPCIDHIICMYGHGYMAG